jgi:hypothetical protein
VGVAVHPFNLATATAIAAARLTPLPRAQSSIKALFCPQAKSVCCVDMGVGSIVDYGIELTPAFSMRPTIRI